MAGSYPYYKKEVTQYLKDNFPTTAKVLDVGAGCGTYYEYLKDYFDNIEAVEVFEPNIKNFNLEQKYKKVYNINILDFKYDYYDIIIFGDILEHLETAEAQQVLDYAFDRCKELIVAVPYLYPQGIEEDNIYEIHKQDDLTNEIMLERYPKLKLLYGD
jgi:2-polyprenyl-3-methyl-5-hydroxy-6-metoxy-1,4-benzoquinol methylase